MVKNFLRLKNISNLNSSFSFQLFSTLENKEHLNRQKEIQIEKRKRNQAYVSLDYLLSRVTYFDFFSADSFKIAKYSKYFAQYFNLSTVTPEILLLSCFYCNSNLSKFLTEYDNPTNLEKNLLNLIPESEKNKNINNLVDAFQTNKEVINKNISYSRQVNQIFLKSAQLALTSFKSPIISSEIIFLTLMEEKGFNTFKIIKKIIGNDTEWYLLRYQLIKHLHNQEASIRSEISKNQQYFAYLLKTELGEIEFNKLLESKSLNEGVSIFRNTLVSESIKIDLLGLILNEVKKSIQITNTRKYSSQL
jgi:hypothetical protein